MIRKITDWFDGKKTFISAGIVFIVAGLTAVGAISAQTASAITGFFSAIGLVLVRINQA